MDYRSIENKLSKHYMETLALGKKNDFTLDDLANKCRISLRDAKLVFPYKDEINQKLLMKIFFKNEDEKILDQLKSEFDKEDLPLFEKLLEGLFLRFEILFQHRSAILCLSSSLNDRISNFKFLIVDSHLFMKKLLLICEEDNNYLKLEVKSFLLNSVYLKEINNFLNMKDYNQNLSMKNIDNDLKKIFELKYIFN